VRIDMQARERVDRAVLDEGARAFERCGAGHHRVKAAELLAELRHGAIGPTPAARTRACASSAITSVKGGM